MQLDLWTCLSSEAPANHSASQGNDSDWMTRVATWHSTPLAWLAACGPVGLCSRTSPASLAAEADGTLVSSSQQWGTSGISAPGGCSMRNISEWPSDGSACSLSDVLETGDVPQRFYLSAKACRGILRRAERRGKSLPPSLHAALLAVASARTSTATED